MLKIIGYVSSAAVEPSADRLSEILKVAVDHNRAAGITGIMFYDEGNIIQFIEGRDEAVSALYARICRDRRHKGIIELMNEPIAERVFPDWSMGLKYLSQLPPDLQAQCRDLMGLKLAPDESENELHQVIKVVLDSFRRSIR